MEASPGQYCHRRCQVLILGLVKMPDETDSKKLSHSYADRRGLRLSRVGYISSIIFHLMFFHCSIGNRGRKSFTAQGSGGKTVAWHKPSRRGRPRRDSCEYTVSAQILVNHLLGDAAMFREVCIEPSAGTNRPLQCGVVHCDDTEFRAQALDPLEVVHQGPVIVALYVYPVLDEPAHLEKVVVDVPCSEGVPGVGRAILSDEDGGMVAVPVLLTDTIQPLRVDLPSKIVLVAVFVYFELAQRVCGYRRTVHDVACIVVDTKEIDEATFAERISPTQWREEPALAHPCDK